MKYLKPKYIQHLTPGLTFKHDYDSFYCIVNNKKILYIYPGGNGGVNLGSQNEHWNENYYKLILTDKELLDRFKL